MEDTRKLAGQITRRKSLTGVEEPTTELPRRITAEDISLGVWRGELWILSSARALRDSLIQVRMVYGDEELSAQRDVPWSSIVLLDNMPAPQDGAGKKRRSLAIQEAFAIAESEMVGSLIRFSAKLRTSTNCVYSITAFRIDTSRPRATLTDDNVPGNKVQVVFQDGEWRVVHGQAKAPANGNGDSE